MQRGRVAAKTKAMLPAGMLDAGFASLAALLSHYRQPSWPEVSRLVAADWEEFVQPESRPTH